MNAFRGCKNVDEIIQRMIEKEPKWGFGDKRFGDFGVCHYLHIEDGVTDIKNDHKKLVAFFEARGCPPDDSGHYNFDKELMFKWRPRPKWLTNEDVKRKLENEIQDEDHSFWVETKKHELRVRDIKKQLELYEDSFGRFRSKWIDRRPNLFSKPGKITREKWNDLTPEQQLALNFELEHELTQKSFDAMFKKRKIQKDEEASSSKGAPTNSFQ
jgi:hypothetical protein